ncbi:hypothetical protein E3O45_15595 [Cryobacterium sp. TMS1-20-1]|uniref:lipopolysaccharide biosynthesis protein n=1 Tax=Cryobacterium sp. TMS1-20-1 TaxID=1259223 RepID=UPI001069EBEC|nr:oligosaccharide flippase family protein [Cryobacterium sp. TMS1-20-1]TFC70737.1 hypothetical protein E3O45_15595 [Cryobacterium sp. TMS1-20-1]
MGRIRSLVGSSSAVAFARIFSLACAAIQLPLLTRLLSPAEYAALAVAITIATYFSLLTAESVILGFERYPGGASSRSNYQYSMGRTLTYTAVGGLLIAASAYPLGLTEEAVAFVGWGIGIAVNRLVSLAWLMWEKPWPYAWNLVAGTGTRTAVLILLIVTGWDPLVSLGMAGAASAIAALLLSPKSRTRFRHESGHHPWTMRFGVGLAIASTSYAILGNGNLLILAAFVPASVVGSYAAMMQVAALTSAAVLGVVLAVAYPPLRRAWDNGQHATVQGKLSTLQLTCVSIATAAVFVCYLGDQYLLRLVLPADYIDPTVLAPLVLSTALATMGGMASWHHQLEFRAGRVALRTVTVAATGTLITVGLSALFAGQGAAAGSLVGYLVYLVVMQAGTGLPLRPILVAGFAVVVTCVPPFLSDSSSNWVSASAFVVACGTFVWAVRRLLRSNQHVTPGRA